MAKGFSEHEKAAIQKGLLDACKECWNKYGYTKTSVRELSQMAGISTGAFYQFYASKEILFFETAFASETHLFGLFEKHLIKLPNKQGIVNGILAVIQEMKNYYWFMSLKEEWGILVRKLPPEYIEKEKGRDILKYAALSTKYNIVPKRELAEVADIINILIMSALLKNNLPGDTDTAMAFIINATISELFE